MNNKKNKVNNKNNRENRIKNEKLIGEHNNYLIENEDDLNHLDTGGNSNVYRVFDDLGNVYAAKVSFHKEKGKDKDKRFNNEIELMLKLNHKNIISIKDYGVSKDGYPFYIMTLYEYTLSDYFKKNKLSLIDIIELFLKILEGLIYLEQNKIVHRDLKPQNILLKDKDNIVISDFGIHKNGIDLKEKNINTKSTEKMANFNYSAPEQRHYTHSEKEDKDKINNYNNYVSHKTDVYAIGLMLKEFLNIKNLYSDNSKCFINYILNQILNVEIKYRLTALDLIKYRLTALDLYYLLNIYLELLINKKSIKDNLNFSLLKFNKKNKEIQFPIEYLQKENDNKNIRCFDNIINISAFFEKDYIKLLMKNIKKCDSKIITEYFITGKNLYDLNLLLYRSNYNFNNEFILHSGNKFIILYFESIPFSIKPKFILIDEIHSFYNVGKYIINLNKNDQNIIKKTTNDFKRNHDIFIKNNYHRTLREHYHSTLRGEEHSTLREKYHTNTKDKHNKEKVIHNNKEESKYNEEEFKYNKENEKRKMVNSTFGRFLPLTQDLIIIYPKREENNYNLKTYFIFDRKIFIL